MPANNIRQFLAGMGAELGGIDTAFLTSDSTGNRMTINNIENADIMMKQRLGMNQPPPIENYNYNIPQMNYQIPQPQMTNFVQQPKESREDRINRLIGKQTPSQPQIQYIQTPRQQEITEGVKEAIAPLLELLEDIAVVNGILVQRIEELIHLVDPNHQIEERDLTQTTSELSDNVDTFQEDIPEMEVYDPGVSMSVLEDEDFKEEIKPKKKKKVKA